MAGPVQAWCHPCPWGNVRGKLAAVHGEQPKLPWIAGLGVDIVILRGKQAEKGAACESRGESSRFLLP
jgi:hypothetical protein